MPRNGPSAALYRDVLEPELLCSGTVSSGCPTASPGHTAALALFEEPEAIARATELGRSSLHHLASVPRPVQIAAEAWLGGKVVLCRIKECRWIGLRGLLVDDPE